MTATLNAQCARRNVTVTKIVTKWRFIFDLGQTRLLHEKLFKQLHKLFLFLISL